MPSRILLPYLPALAVKDEEGKEACEGDAGGHVEPDAGEAERPEQGDHADGEDERGGDGNERGLERLFDCDHEALGGEAEPARDVGKTEKAQGAHAHGEQFARGIGHKETGHGLGDAAHKEHHGDGGDGGADEAAAFDGAHTAVSAGAPVVADGRLQGVAHAVKERLDEPVDEEQHTVDGDGHGAAQANEDGVHEDLGDAAGDVIEKVGAAAGNDLPEQAQAEPWSSEVQDGLAAQERRKGDKRTDTHAETAGQRGGPDTPAENAEEEVFEAPAEHAHEDVEPHAAADEAGDAQVIVKGEHGRGER